ncbi:hypothetical protein TDB9533_01252 [Thalassocella blandensis]|nr:hypothetical protein TDB9533_01252 [Thalassocella blandensis]
MTNSTLSDMRTSAKTLNVSRAKLLDMLERHHIFSRNPQGQRLPCAKFIQQGYFVRKDACFQCGDVQRQCLKPMTTEKGMDFLRDFINKLPPDEQAQLEPKPQRGKHGHRH